MTLREFLDEEYAIVRGLKPKAVYQIRLTLRRWAEFLGREPERRDLTNLSVQKFLMARKEKVSQGSVLKDRNGIVGLWNYIAKQDRSLSFPTLPPMSPIKRVPKAYTVADVSKLIRLARGLVGDLDGVPRGLWWASVQRCAWETAERCSAILACTWEDVDLVTGRITFRGENRKGGRADIERDISPELCQWLAAMRGTRGPKEKVWPWPKCQSSLWLEHNRLAAVAEVMPRGFHGFRKSCASYLAAASSLAVASEHLGHASTSMTRDHYISPDIARPKVSPVSMLPPLDLG